MTQSAQQPCLKIEGVSKAFNTHQVLNGISFEIMPGEIRGLLGANGAGKSTLIKILSGAYAPDEGTIKMAGKEIQVGSISAARSAGIAVVNQELMLFPDRTVAENIVAANIPQRPLTFLSASQRCKSARQTLARLGSNIDVTRRLDELALSERQFVEIARALFAGGDLLILDEPTSALSALECDGLFEAVRVLARQGTSVVFVSHRLDEVIELADSVTILRDGRVEGTWQTSDIDVDGITHAMVGDVEPVTRKTTGPKKGRDIIQLTGFTTDQITDVNLTIKEGEIVGFAGLEGSGTAALLEAMAGLVKVSDGEYLLDGVSKSYKHIAEAIADGVVYMPPERKHGGLWLDRTCKHNIAAAFVQRLSPGKFLNRREISDRAMERIKEVQVRSSALETNLELLSGGNQQRVLLGRCLEQCPKILLLSDFTRGVDVSAKAIIHDIVLSLAAQGITVCVISTEFNELIQICDRIVCMRNGKVASVVPAQDADEPKILKIVASGERNETNHVAA